MVNKILIGFLMILNVFILYLYYGTKKELQVITNDKTDVLIYDKAYISYRDLYQYETAEKIETEFKLIVYIYETGCPSCNKYVATKINTLYEKYPSYIDVRVLGVSKNYVSQIGGKFPYKKLRNEEYEFFSIENDEALPINVIVDKNGMIQKIHTVNFQTYSKSDIFYKLTDSFLETLKNKATN